jgi:hypothetical protein
MWVVAHAVVQGAQERGRLRLGRRQLALVEGERFGYWPFSTSANAPYWMTRWRTPGSARGQRSCAQARRNCAIASG